MIKLADTVVAQFDHLKNPPTHAKLTHIKHSIAHQGLELSPGQAAAMPQDELYVVYALGAVLDGRFVAYPKIDVVQCLVDMKDYAKDAPPPRLLEVADIAADHEQMLKRSAAARNLFGADVAPKPGAPHESTSALGKPEGEYRFCDVDAIVCHFEPRLFGTVV